MKLNLAETLLVNNPFRRWVQKFYEGPRLLKMGGSLEGQHVLEIGCGHGVGIEILFEQFHAGMVHAIDLDPKMVEKAQKRLSRFSSKQLLLAVGDVSDLQMPETMFDAVFDFGILHHVPDWQKALREIHRVLKPRGLFFFEEVSRSGLQRWLYRTLLEHPRENRFSREEFSAELGLCNYEPVAAAKSFCFDDFFIGVSRKT